MNKSGYTEKGFKRKLAVQALFGKVFYLSEVGRPKKVYLTQFFLSFILYVKYNVSNYVQCSEPSDMIILNVVSGFAQQLLWANNTEIVLGRCGMPDNIPYHQSYCFNVLNPSYKMKKKQGEM